MSWTSSFLAYLGTAATLVVLDLLWLGLVAREWYRQGIGHLMAPEMNVLAGGAFYLLFPLGLLVFAVWPGVASPRWWRTAIRGALFGFFAYATYDLTNLATLRGWPLSVSLIDVAWGSLASAMSALAGRAVVSARA